jgi:4a-hydroxytetrahydrobiopterin dehydratase
MPVLTPAQINDSLARLPDWKLEGGNLVRTLVFTDFREAMSFVNSVAALAERAGHHPDIDIRYNKVRLALSTHDAGGITGKDVALAAEIGETL